MPKVLHVNQLLTNISVKYRNPAYVGEALFPVMPVSHKSDDFLVYEKADRFTPTDDRLGPKAEAREVDWASHTDTYACKNFGLRDFVSNEDIANADAPIKPETDTAEFLTDLLLLNREIRIRDKVLGISQNATPGTKWNAATGSDPVADIEAAIDGCFIKPNVMIIPRSVMKVLKWHPKLVDAIKYVGVGKITAEHIAELFDVDKVLVAGAKVNTAKKGKTPVYADVWGPNVALAYVDPKAGLNAVTFGRTFSWKFATAGGQVFQVRRWEEPKRGLSGGNMVQVETSTDEKIVAADCGYLLKNVLS